MKQIKIILLLTAIAFSFSTMAQFTYGPRLGVNFATLGGDDEDGDYKTKIGLNLGAMGNYGINDMFSIQAELLYSAKGAKSEYKDEDGDTESMPLSLGYIDIPIMLKATFGNDIKFFGLAGPTIGILMSAKFDGESEYTSYDFDPNNPMSPPVEKKVKYKDSFNGTDIGFVIGGGAVVPIGDMPLIIDIRYNSSLGTIADDDDWDIKNSVISINFGMLFGG